MSSLLIAGFGAASGIGVLIMISGLVGRPVLPTLGSFERRREVASRATVRSGGAAAAFLATLAVTGWPVGTFVRGRRVMWQGELVTPSTGETIRFMETLKP